MKNQRRFKAPNYSRGCLLAKAFGVSAANSGERTPLAVSTPEAKIKNPDIIPADYILFVMEL
jgi:transcription elongation factor